MDVVEERQGDEAGLARVWVQGRPRVLRATMRSFPTSGSVMVEAAVDRAWEELYERGQAGPPERLLGRWKRLAYLRALNGVRERTRHPTSVLPVEELAEMRVLDVGDSLVGVEELLRAEARAQEIVHQVSGDARCWIEAVFDDPSAPPREIARTLGWDREKLKSVSRRTRARLRAFVSARASGAICERRQAVMAAFAATYLARRDPEYAERCLGEHAVLGARLYEQVAFHIAGCEECERVWRRAHAGLLRQRLVFLPVALAGKLAAAGTAAIAVGRRVLGRLERLCCEVRVRVGSGMGRASAGGAAGTAGTAGALAGKGAAVCVGVLCATGAGTAALVGLPTDIVTSRTASHHHRHAVIAPPRAGRSDLTVIAAANMIGASQTTVAHSVTSTAESNHAKIARAARRGTHPVVPGSLVATASATGARKGGSEPSAHVASLIPTATSGSSGSASSSVSRSEVTTEYVPSTSSARPSSSSSRHGPCVPGSLTC